jgi:predicted O-methyltransferase YrrM
LRESRWTRPSDECPSPGYWHAIDYDSTEIEVIEAVAGLVRALQPEYAIETGTASAQMTRAIGEALKRNRHGRLVSLEVEPVRVERGRRLCRRLPVEIRQQSSLEFTPDRAVDFAWFDTIPEIRHEEFRRYYPRMHRRTIVGFHDTAGHHPTRALVDELEAAGMLRTIDFPTPRGFSIGRVIPQDSSAGD